MSYLGGSAYETAVDDEPALTVASGNTCGRCGLEKQRPDWLFCFGCIVTFDERSIASFEQARDELADWIVEAEQVLTAMSPDDSRYAAGKAMWERRLRSYQCLAWLIPEQVG